MRSTTKSRRAIIIIATCSEMLRLHYNPDRKRSAPAGGPIIGPSSPLQRHPWRRQRLQLRPPRPHGLCLPVEGLRVWDSISMGRIPAAERYESALTPGSWQVIAAPCCTAVTAPGCLCSSYGSPTLMRCAASGYSFFTVHNIIAFRVTYNWDRRLFWITTAYRRQHAHHFPTKRVTPRVLAQASFVPGYP